MAAFGVTQARRDARLIRRFGVPLRYRPAVGQGWNLEGVIDLDVEYFGDQDDLHYQGKVVTLLVQALPTHRPGDQVQELDSAGNPIGPVFNLERTLRDDGTVKMIGMS